MRTRRSRKGRGERGTISAPRYPELLEVLQHLVRRSPVARAWLCGGVITPRRSVREVGRHDDHFLATTSVMVLLVVVIVLALGCGLAVLVNVNRIRAGRRVAGEMRALVAAPPSGLPRADVGELPPPVARYRTLAVGDRAPVHTLRLRHGGTFRMSPTAKASPIRGEQLFTADPPGFVWTGHIGMAPGVWIDARDMFVDGKGSMRVQLDSTVTVVDAHGPQLDQGSALRLLAEMAWYPTAPSPVTPSPAWASGREAACVARERFSRDRR